MSSFPKICKVTALGSQPLEYDYWHSTRVDIQTPFLLCQTTLSKTVPKPTPFICNSPGAVWAPAHPLACHTEETGTPSRHLCPRIAAAAPESRACTAVCCARDLSDGHYALLATLCHAPSDAHSGVSLCTIDRLSWVPYTSLGEGVEIGACIVDIAPIHRSMTVWRTGSC